MVVECKKWKHIEFIFFGIRGYFDIYLSWKYRELVVDSVPKPTAIMLSFEI